MQHKTLSSQQAGLEFQGKHIITGADHVISVKKNPNE